MKTDARVRYTRKVLQDALFACLKMKNIREITVTEVCALAGLNRATFYKHYRDCYDILEQLQERELEEFRTLMETRDKFGGELIEACLALLERYHDLNEATVQGRTVDGLRQKMMETARACSMDEWKKAMPEVSAQEVEMRFSAIAAAVFQIAVIETGKYDRGTVVRFIEELIRDAVRPYAATD